MDQVGVLAVAPLQLQTVGTGRGALEAGRGGGLRAGRHLHRRAERTHPDGVHRLNTQPARGQLSYTEGQHSLQGEDSSATQPSGTQLVTSPEHTACKGRTAQLHRGRSGTQLVTSLV